MRWLLLSLLPIALTFSGCTSASYDLMETASISTPRFGDKDPQDFGAKTPHRHKVHGIDVSKWNGDVDWVKVRKSGVSFAFIKATEGKDVVDSRFDEYWRQAAAAGIPHAPYHFYYFCSTADEQADWFIRNVPKASMHLPPVLDVEWNHTSKTCNYRPSAMTVRAEMKRFMDRIEAYYGKRPIIYTSVDFHRDNLEGSFQDYHFWVRAVAQHPEEIYPDRRWAFWQYTSTGVIPGIKGDTDINVFAGTEKNWKNWVAAVSKR
ncbi:MAG: glycoside hydrolase family 25 protein [Alphaproteobacteria bacterium]|nr:glycoside hydrolase family 25 protein [Rhizobiaceae bacterium]MBU3963973.1 glycoside hydrolase family 25 protein [Alphaproteobacteria bacterium]MBU4049971.1 glycoside hydrolase family 25 protein [Alphaproteobacteria bacterium]MBU4087477.1 glycoside hydrolase family 25 protein [Alphaproteobacteria bacterium]MBU4155278.1 glycoside hydrolase family 25 protein [Alphaproteobacteria bacterium]